MRKFFALTLGCFAALSLQPCNADVLLQVPQIPGSAFTVGRAINDNNVIAGYFLDGSTGGKVHAFFEPLDGSSYTIFDDSSGVALPTGIDNTGTIVGQTLVTDQGICDVIPFERTSDGKIVHIRKGKESLTGAASGLNNKEEFVGYYCDGNGDVLSYSGKRGKYKSPLTIAGSPANTLAYGINKSGTIAGYFGNSPGSPIGFIWHNGITEVVQYPNAVSTLLTDINDHGVAFGTETDAQSVTSVFTFDDNSQTFKIVAAPGNFQSAGMNNRGMLVLIYSSWG